MKDLIEAIEQALADDATADAKQRGAEACRAILTALDTEPGASLAPSATIPAEPPGNMDPTQVLDLVIDRLRAIVEKKDATAGTAPSEARPSYRVEYVQIPREASS